MFLFLAVDLKPDCFACIWPRCVAMGCGRRQRSCFVVNDGNVVRQPAILLSPTLIVLARIGYRCKINSFVVSVDFAVCC